MSRSSSQTSNCPLPGIWGTHLFLWHIHCVMTLSSGRIGTKDNWYLRKCHPGGRALNGRLTPWRRSLQCHPALHTSSAEPHLQSQPSPVEAGGPGSRSPSATESGARLSCMRSYAPPPSLVREHRLSCSGHGLTGQLGRSHTGRDGMCTLLRGQWGARLSKLDFRRTPPCM